MTASRPADLADRYLAFAVRALPRGRREWGRAMRAELVVIQGRLPRWIFALGCTGAALRHAFLAVALARPLAGFCCAVLVLVGQVVATRLVGSVPPLAAVLVLLAWRGRRSGFFGPVRSDRPSRVVRAAGYGLVAVLFGVALVNATGVDNEVYPLMVTFLAALVLAGTARASRPDGPAFALGVAGGALGGLAGFLVLPFDRVLPPLADSLPGSGRWLAGLPFVVPVVVGALAARRTGRAYDGVAAAFGAGTFTVLFTVVIGLATLVLVPGAVPDFVGAVMVPGTSHAARRAADLMEAADPSVGLLAYGLLLGTVLWVLVRPPASRWVGRLMITVLGAAPVWFTLSTENFPGLRLIRTATILLVCAALAVAPDRRPDSEPARPVIGAEI